MLLYVMDQLEEVMVDWLKYSVYAAELLLVAAVTLLYVMNQFEEVMVDWLKYSV